MSGGLLQVLTHLLNSMEDSYLIVSLEQEGTLQQDQAEVPTAMLLGQRTWFQGSVMEKTSDKNYSNKRITV